MAEGKKSLFSRMMRGIFVVPFIILGNMVAGYFRLFNREFRESRRPLAKAMIAFAFFFFIPTMVPVGIITTVAVSTIAVDQAIYPKNSINPMFKDSSLINKTDEEKGIVIYEALIYQLEKELNSQLGWTLNDFAGLQYLDNRSSRQEGIAFAVKFLMNNLSLTMSKQGIGSDDNDNLTEAVTRLSKPPTFWGKYGMMIDCSEENFEDGAGYIRLYQDDLRSGRAFINFKTDDLFEVLDVMLKRILANPYGKLGNRNDGKKAHVNDIKDPNTLKGKEVVSEKDDSSGEIVKKVVLQGEIPYWDLDNRIYFAQGVAIVIRDVLSATLYSYYNYFEKGSEANILGAIDSLEAAAKFNPYWVGRGRGDSVWADHRAKMSVYFTNAIRGIEETQKSIKH
ncbi:DUF2333 family protein [Patescibacteria group bacterium]